MKNSNEKIGDEDELKVPMGARTQLLEFSIHEIASMNRDPGSNECKEETPREFIKTHKEEHDNNSTNPNTYSNIITPQSTTIQ